MRFLLVLLLSIPVGATNAFCLGVGDVQAKSPAAAGACSSTLGRAVEKRPAATIRSDVDIVLVPVTVTDEMNRPVLGLQKKDFAVFEGNQPQPISVFSQEDAPISIGVLLDLSKSMSNKLVTERAALEEFSKNANPGDDYFVVTFADQPQLLASNGPLEEIAQDLAGRVPEGHTALLDAVYMAVAQMRSARYPRRALLVISDGGDNHSRYRLKEIRNLVEEANIEVYAIGIFEGMFFRSFEETMGKRWLSEITDVTGGYTVPVSGLAKVPQTAAALSRQMRSQYVLGYRPQNPARDGKWRKLKVSVSSAPGSPKLQVHHKKGYYAGAR